MPHHPNVLLANNTHKLDTWLSNTAAEHPSIALGAIGELVAAETLEALIVSADVDGHDLIDGEVKIEVKAKLEERRWNPSLGKKDADKVVRVTLARHPVNGQPDELWAERLEIRDRHDDNWATVGGFKRRRVDNLV